VISPPARSAPCEARYVSSVTRRKPSALTSQATFSSGHGERSAGRAVRAVVLPGSGSDARFVRSAFGPALRARGITLNAVQPRPGGDVVAGYRAALEAAGARP